MKALAPNSLIQNRYLIVHLIGKGGMGEVYLAVDQRLGSAIALKRTFFADDEMLGGAFEREARTLARLRHPVLPKVSDHFLDNGDQYLVMEHISGDDLSKRLETANKPFPVSWVLFWADQLLDALAYLHSHEPPIIHRDIKPQNLKLTDENHIILLDFGLSKNSTGASRVSTSGSTGSVVGYTPHYAPMEQIRGTGTSPKSDLYSLSATLYQLMTNEVPADALTRADSLLNGNADPIRPLFELNPEISPDVSAVIMKGMEVSQEKRFGDAKQMQKTLRKAYTEMQEAMSAHTVAFNSAGEVSSRIEQPAGVMQTPEPQQKFATGESEEATKIRTEPPVETSAASLAANGGQDLDATVQYDGPIDGGTRQADVKTEVYHAGDTPLYTPSEETPATPITSQPETFTTNDTSGDFGSPTPMGLDDFTPDSTVPNISTGDQPPASPFAGGEDFSSTVGAAPDPFTTRTASTNAPEQAFAAPSQVRMVPAKKKSSKAVWVVVGMMALMLLVVVGAGAGWFVYSNYYATSIPEPTPSPEATILPTPSPEPTMEAVIESNSNSDLGTNSVSDTNTSPGRDDLTVAPTPIPQVETSETTPTTRPTPQIVTKKTPVKTATTPGGAKPTPKPKTGGDRTVILQ